MTTNTETLTPVQQELLNKVDVVLSYAGNAVSSAVEFTKEQVPDIAYQFITFNRAYLSAIELISLVTLGIGLWLMINVATRNTCGFEVDKRLGIWASARKSAMIFGVIISFISFVFFMVNFKSFFLVWFAPKIFLLTTLASLIKG